jgi:hypothetical protein
MRCCIAFCVAIGVTPSAHATPTVDQQQPIIDTAVGGLAIGGDSSQKLAQVITAGMSGHLTEVRLPVACDSGSTLIVEIQEVTDSAPNGVVLTSQAVTGDSLPPFFPSPPSFRSLVLSTPAFLNAGKQFAIVLTSAGSCGVFQGPVGDTYQGGNLYFDALPNPPGWVCVCSFAGDRFDLPFQTVVETACVPPALNSMSATPSTLSPVNHRMVDVAVDYEVAGTCPTSCTLNVASNEAPNGVGDGNTAPDWVVIDPHRVRLRAERAGGGFGRLYTITAACTTATGQLSARHVVVTVRHDQRK